MTKDNSWTKIIKGKTIKNAKGKDHEIPIWMQNYYSNGQQ